MMVRTTPNSFPIYLTSPTSSVLPLLGVALTSLVGFGFEDEGDVLRLAARNGYFLRLLTISLVTGCDCVLAGRKIRQTETAIVAGNGVVRVFQDGKCAVHPWMHIAFHRNEFGLVVFVEDRRGARGLGLVPLAVNFGQGMNVVRGLVVINDFQGLVNLKSEDVRNILATLLVKGCRLARGGVVWSARRNVHHHIFKAVARSGHHRFGRNRRGVLLGAAGLLGHVNGFGFCRRAFICHFSTDAASIGPRGEQGDE